jgi:hypothetical protein
MRVDACGRGSHRKPTAAAMAAIARTAAALIVNQRFSAKTAVHSWCASDRGGGHNRRFQGYQLRERQLGAHPNGRAVKTRYKLYCSRDTRDF